MEIIHHHTVSTQLNSNHPKRKRVTNYRGNSTIKVKTMKVTTRNTTSNCQICKSNPRNNDMKRRFDFRSSLVQANY